MRRNNPTLEYVRTLLSYDPETGEIRWRVDRPPGCKAGALAGAKATSGVRIMIDGKRYAAHRVAWLLTHGEWPEGILDHRDRNPYNNRLDNIRPATSHQNTMNRSLAVNNTSGVRGVSFLKKKKLWMAFIQVNGKTVHLGKSKCKDKAIARRREAELKYFGEFSPLT